MSSGGVQGDHLSRYTGENEKRKPMHHQMPAIAYMRCCGLAFIKSSKKVSK
jgi:hypothetical protein